MDGRNKSRKLGMNLKIFFSLFFFLISSLSFAGEGDTYSFTWLDPDKEVYVLQNRKFRKSGKLHLNIGAGLTTSGAFVDTTTFQGRAGYFFSEDWGFEGVYAINNGEENSTAETLRNRGQSGSIPFRRIVDSYVGGMVLWSPFYSKINTFNTIIYLDFVLGAGLAQLQETNNIVEFSGVPNDPTPTTLTHTGLIWDAALKFYLNENFEIRTDLTVIHYEAEKPTRSGFSNETTYFSNWDFAISLGYRF